MTDNARLLDSLLGDPPTTGVLTILNVGAGDIELKFNPHQPEEVARAIEMLLGMQKQGYAILVKQEDGSYARATHIDATRGLYVITGSPTRVIEGQVVPQKALPAGDPGVLLEAESHAATDPSPRRRGRRPKRTQPIVSSEAITIGRSAGG